MTWGRHRRPAQTPTPPVTPTRTLWNDSLGTLATRSIQIIAIALLASALVLGLRALTLVVIPVLLALILASAFSPFMNVLRRRGLGSLPSTLIVLLTIVVALGAVGWLIVSSVRSQWQDLYDQANEGIQQVLAWVSTLPFHVDDGQIQEWIDQATGFLTSAQFGSGALAGVGAVADFITGLVLMVVVLFFFLKDGPVLWEFLRRPFTGEWHARATRAGRKAVDTLGSYVRGTAAVAAVDAIGIGVGLAILQVPLWPALAVLVFVLAFIPIVGAVLAGVLAALVALVAKDLVVALIVVGIVVLVNQLEGNFLQPVLMGRALKLHSLVILIALTIGTVLGGIIGAVLAVPLTAVAWGIVKVWDGPDQPARWARRKDAVRA
ncbi:AI-2E family transporter [Microbacterium marinilacus]|uniref:AI-2E family transporter n=1 Tax=Microbacterium marinilacus TaxID=415209 RepID=A0ABP7BKD6_9MICO|nr:AI-2E family transporter [Microbacterium marinilacus]MBY0689772.1 AI-2E family transporter [Microbacterium marinilacus]